ncbi:MAG: hypothetical protein ACRCZF_07810, partial [Gemmataceae bacterium]
LLATAGPTRAAEDLAPPEGVRKATLRIEPAEAKPGQTVTLKVELVLNPGCRVYPFRQTDKAADSFRSRVKFPANTAEGAIYVGEMTSSTEPETKSEPELMIEKLQFYTGTVLFEQKIVISPKAAAGELEIKTTSLKFNICDEKDCFKPTDLKPVGKVKVLAGPAAAVEKEFAEAVEKVLAGK